MSSFLERLKFAMSVSFFKCVDSIKSRGQRSHYTQEMGNAEVKDEMEPAHNTYEVKTRGEKWASDPLEGARDPVSHRPLHNSEIQLIKQKEQQKIEVSDRLRYR